ncbi:MAG: dethiobiotin synthase [Cytophagales bacterium]
MQNYFVTAIGTNSGKTIFSAVLVEFLQADYWKPIQSGTEDKDSDTIKQLLNNNYSLIHPSRFELKLPASPHQSALEEGVQVKLSDFELPFTENHLVIEGAGGVLVPLNEENEFVIDMASKFEAELILVSDFYLGSINHTLLTFNELKI